MGDKNCHGCGRELQMRGKREASCSNKECPEGGRFVRCGFCDELFLSVARAGDMRCLNSECRVHDRRRAQCPDCRKASRIDWKGKKVCLNRNCPGNASTVTECFFCHENAFLNGDNLMFCTRGSCPELLEEMESCECCGKTSRSIRTASCHNAQCAEYGPGPDGTKEEATPPMGIGATYDEDLDRLIALWPALPGPVRKAMVVLAESAGGRGQ